MNIVLFLIMISLLSVSANEVRVKDVAHINGVEELQIFGYGLVVGLAGTGDRSSTVFTFQTVRNMLKNMGIELPERQINLQNVAAVMVTGTLDPFKKRGSRLDVTVSSLGDARSLEGGTLLLTPLQGPDGSTYASAQGPLSTGGYDIRNRGISQVKRNHTLVGRIPDGALVQSEYAFSNFSSYNLAFSLSRPDFTSAVNMAMGINGSLAAQFGITERIAIAKDAATVKLDYERAMNLIDGRALDLAEFIAFVENATFVVETQARIVLNERTGTIVAGSNVRISEVAVSHGGIKVEIMNRPEVVMPQPFTLTGAVTVAHPEQVVEERDMDMVVLGSTATVAELAHALNSLGVSSRDVITIFQAIKEAGALQGQLIVM